MTAQAGEDGAAPLIRVEYHQAPGSQALGELDDQAGAADEDGADVLSRRISLEDRPLRIGVLLPDRTATAVSGHATDWLLPRRI